MAETFDAYFVDNCIQQLIRSGRFGTYTFDEKTEQAILRLAELADKIKSNSNDGEGREFYISVKSPTLEEYKEREREGIEKRFWRSEGLTDKNLKENYAYSYPEEQKWYQILIIHRPKIGRSEEFVGVFVNRDYVLSVGDTNASKGWKYDESEFVDFLYGKTEEVISHLSDGSYNLNIEQYLPHGLRYGIILRKAYRDMFPEVRKDFLKDTTKEELSYLKVELDRQNEIIVNAEKEQTDDIWWSSKQYGVPDGAYDTMTARKYFEAVAIGSLSVNYERRTSFKTYDVEEKESAREYKKYAGTEFDYDGSGKHTPRTIYSEKADGRDDGLTNVPLDNAAAFERWMHEKGPYYEFNGHHPYEVRTSGSIELSLHLYPAKDEKSGKWYFILSGDAYTSSAEILKWLTAMKKHNIPVDLSDVQRIAGRFFETDNIGIVPDYFNTLFSGYIPRRFDGQNVGDIVNLPETGDSMRNAVINTATWLPEKKVELAAEPKSE